MHSILLDTRVARETPRIDPSLWMQVNPAKHRAFIQPLKAHLCFGGEKVMEHFT
jgi:hypothetical protein